MTAPTIDEVCRRFPHLEFTESGTNRLDEVLELLAAYRACADPLADDALEQFLSQLAYLNNYGGAISDQDRRRRYRVTLGRDFAMASFALTWRRLDVATGRYVFAFCGGLIWHGGPHDPLCVSIVPQLWGIHT